MDRISEPKREKVYLFNSLDVAKILMHEQKLCDSTWWFLMVKILAFKFTKN